VFIKFGIIKEPLDAMELIELMDIVSKFAVLVEEKELLNKKLLSKLLNLYDLIFGVDLYVGVEYK
jgi:hypothetical protein